MIPIRLCAIVILILWAADAAESLRENETCHKEGLPAGRCKLFRYCSTLPLYFEKGLFTLDDVMKCGFKDPYDSMLYCCPDLPPPTPAPTRRPVPTRRPAPTRLPAPTQRPNGKWLNYLVSLEYLKPVRLDDFVYRCTAIVLTPSYVLATTKCVGKDIIGRPNKVLFGSTDSRRYEASQFEIEIKNFTSYNNELILIELANEIPSSELLENVSKAPLCNKSDLLGEPNLIAWGYSYDVLEETNCELFSQKLLLKNANNCMVVKSNRQIENLRRQHSHMCTLPEIGDGSFTLDNRRSCLNCLTGTTSVLHVKRPNGYLCVAGIATPTTDECRENRQHLYYTNIVSDNGVNDFLNSIINV